MGKGNQRQGEACRICYCMPIPPRRGSCVLCGCSGATEAYQRWRSACAVQCQRKKSCLKYRIYCIMVASRGWQLREREGSWCVAHAQCTILGGENCGRCCYFLGDTVHSYKKAEIARRGPRPAAARKLSLRCGRTPWLPGYGSYGVCLGL